MKTLGEILKLSTEYIRQKGSSHTRREVEELIAFTLGKKRLDLYLNFDKPLNENELGLIRKNIARLGANEPLQYIEGAVQFYGCEIMVDRRVLIPRPETELLVDSIVKEIRLHPYDNKELWDVCTGSGCIGIAIKKALPALRVVLSDLSQDALDVARMNAKHNGVELEFLQGDLLKPFGNRKADFIVCNPPYIREDEYAGLDPHVQSFEPKCALVSGKTGLECYERLKKELPKGATVWLEIGHSQGESLREIWGGGEVFQDLSGSDRFFRAT
jgi:release factor glutamine methyltransferase